jgi:hypothetical protein
LSVHTFVERQLDTDDRESVSRKERPAARQKDHTGHSWQGRPPTTHHRCVTSSPTADGAAVVVVAAAAAAAAAKSMHSDFRQTPTIDVARCQANNPCCRCFLDLPPYDPIHCFDGLVYGQVVAIRSGVMWSRFGTELRFRWRFTSELSVGLECNSNANGLNGSCVAGERSTCDVCQQSLEVASNTHND